MATNQRTAVQVNIIGRDGSVGPPVFNHTHAYVRTVYYAFRFKIARSDKLPVVIYAIGDAHA